MCRKNDIEKLYEGRLYLFGRIPLWKVKHTKKEWLNIALMQTTKKRVVEIEFEEEKWTTAKNRSTAKCLPFLFPHL